MADSQSQYSYTRTVLVQMFVVLALLTAVVVWQREVFFQIYLENQVNKVGWVVNGSIALLFFSGLAGLVSRFFEYRLQEASLNRFLTNVSNNDDPMLGVDRGSMVAERYMTLRSLNRRRASINQNALAATLMAAESSRNSYLKFVHNVLILTGVFGTIISLSIALLGASDLIHGSVRPSAESGGLGTMIFGMSTALSTTMTAIIAYLIFGYFYIKLTDTQTYLISRVEEVTATTLLPHLQLNQDAVVKDYSDSIRSAGKLIQRFDQSQAQYDESVRDLQAATRLLAERVGGGGAAGGDEEIVALLHRLGQLQEQSAQENRELLGEVIMLLQKGFRLRDSRSDGSDSSHVG